ncbi:MAG: hypothetical protein JW782_04780 [Candidatus Saganbacteria bacterium]|nr:hypothetical protein [Candidatus Saganbacteria bacterium]
MKKILCSTLCFLLSTILVASSLASVPGQISYQGILKDSAGSPLTGSYSMTFTLYDAASGGTSVWTETQSVSVEAGLYNIQLGSVSTLSASVFNGSTRYLGVKVGSDAEMTPRVVMVTVPYAYRAAIADTALTSSTTVDADTVDGFHASQTPTANTILPLNSSGFITLLTSGNAAAYLSTSADNSTTISCQANGTGEVHNIAGSFSAKGNNSYGVSAQVDDGNSTGVYGYAANNGTSTTNYGGHFISNGGTGAGVFGVTYSHGSGKGVYGSCNEFNAGYAGYFDRGLGIRVVTRPDFPPGDYLEAGTMFFNTTDKKLYICVDPTSPTSSWEALN